MEAASFHRLARRELIDAACYYESESPTLGERFLEAVERGIKEVLAFPDAGYLLEGEVRRRLVDGFPYAILYRRTSETVRILAIMNLKRRPAYWVERK